MGALARVPTREVAHRPEVVASRRRDDFEALWLTVITSAVEDLFSPGFAATAQDQSDALHFLTDKVGAWAVSRRDVATAAGVDPDGLWDHVVAILEGKEPPEGMLSTEGGKQQKNLSAGVQAARKMWAQRRALDQETLERSRALAADAAERRAKERAAADQREARNATFKAWHDAALERRATMLERKAEGRRLEMLKRKAEVERKLERKAEKVRKAAPLHVAPEPRREEFFTLTPLEIDGLPYGQIATFKQAWVFGDYCTTLDTYLPDPRTTCAKMLIELTQPEAILSGDFAHGEARWEGLRKIEAIVGLSPIFFEPDGCPALRAKPHFTMRLRQRP